MNKLTPEQVESLNAVIQCAASKTSRREPEIDDCPYCGVVAPGACGDSCKRAAMIKHLIVVSKLANNRHNHETR